MARGLGLCLPCAEIGWKHRLSTIRRPDLRDGSHGSCTHQFDFRFHRARCIGDRPLRHSDCGEASVQRDRPLGESAEMDRNVAGPACRTDLGVGRRLRSLKSGWKGKWDKGLGAIAREPGLLPKLERMVLVQWKIRLLLNPTEADHQELSRTIDTAMQRLQSEESHESDTRADVENITSLGRAILKREWERVKQGT